MSDFMKLDSARLEQAARTQGGKSPEQAPPGADVAAFNRAMEDKRPEGRTQAWDRPQLQPGQPEQGGQGAAEHEAIPTGRTLPDGVSRREAQEQGGQSGQAGGREQTGQAGSREQTGQAGQAGSEQTGQTGQTGQASGREQSGQAGHERATGKVPGQEQDAETPLNQLFSQMSSPLDSLFSGRMPEVAPKDGVAAAHDIGDIAERLVERILVSTPAEGASEVRIKLGGNALPDTEILIQRGMDGRLEIRLETQNASSFQTLVGAQDALKAQLERTEKNVMVTVVSEGGSTDAESGDSRQRSRGYTRVDEDDQRRG